jgi:integrase
MSLPAGGAPHQAPYRRTYADGRFVWVARFYDRAGKARYAKPRWHGYKSSFALRRDAQRAIDEALERLYQGAQSRRGVGEYFRSWVDRHPRSERTNKTNTDRISSVLDVEIEGLPLRDWEFDELRRRHVLELLDHMLRVEGRAARGARGIISTYSAMAEDAIGDDAATHNAFAGIRVRGADLRVRKPPREIRIWTFQQMRAFARGGRAEVRAATRRPQGSQGKMRRGVRGRFYPARDYEALLLTPGFTGLRLGEFLALKEAEFDGKAFHLHATAHEGELIASSPQKNHERSVPVPPTLAKLIISRRPSSVESELLFPTPTGKLWRERNFYRDVWVPATLATGLDPTPHELRHSYVTNLRAAGIDDADLAEIAGHEVETMIAVYTHALERSHEHVRQIIG